MPEDALMSSGVVERTIPGPAAKAERLVGGIEGRVVVITGAAGGIGAATAATFARHGARLLLVDRAEAALHSLADELIQDADAEVEAVVADITRDDDVTGFIQIALRRFGRIDLAFNNAGIGGGGKAADMVDEAQWAETLAVNLTGTWRCMKHQIAAMRAGGGGAIVNNCSVFGITGGMGAAYTASKHGIAGLTRSAALTCADYGIRVNAVCPGMIDVGLGQQAVEGNPERLAYILEQHPMGRSGTAGEVADAVLYLCSDLARYVTGHLLPVDGGYLAR